jgi:hypothetical protein
MPDGGPWAGAMAPSGKRAEDAKLLTPLAFPASGPV